MAASTACDNGVDCSDSRVKLEEKRCFGASFVTCSIFLLVSDVIEWIRRSGFKEIKQQTLPKIFNISLHFTGSCFLLPVLLCSAK